MITEKIVLNLFDILEPLYEKIAPALDILGPILEFVLFNGLCIFYIWVGGSALIGVFKAIPLLFVKFDKTTNATITKVESLEDEKTHEILYDVFFSYEVNYKKYDGEEVISSKRLDPHPCDQLLINYNSKNPEYSAFNIRAVKNACEDAFGYCLFLSGLLIFPIIYYGLLLHEILKL